MPMINISPPDLFLALYPELHYRFRFFKFSRYFNREPEILIDIPRRIENDRLPVLLIVKDSHTYPLKLSPELSLTFRDRAYEFTRKINLDAENIEQPLWWKVFELEGIAPGDYYVYARLSYTVRGKEKKIVNHNHPGLKEAPLFITSAFDRLPKPPGYKIGDLHTHSYATSDQIEFGAPLKPMSRLSKAMGLDFVGVTDHSYDIDDEPDNYLKNDPDLHKWNSLLKETTEINSNLDPSHAEIILGQEITVRNSRNRNVHFLLFGGDKFFPGSGDSAEKWFRTRSEHSIKEIIEMKQQGSLAIAAHPFEHVPFLQKILLGRDVWYDEDFTGTLKHAQIANGVDYASVSKSILRWRKLLRQGKFISLIAGTDAHGNFNRYRQVYLPMWSLAEHEMHTLGKHFTGVFTFKNSDTLSALTNGATYISDGPGIDLTVNEVKPGGIAEAGELNVRLHILSTQETGALKKVNLIYTHGAGVWQEKNIETKEKYELITEMKIDVGKGFIYASALTSKGKFCFTSAVQLQ